MKPNIDLEDPRVKHIIELHNSQMHKALAAEQRVENSVLPIYHTLKSDTKPEQIGSGVVVKISDEYFIFSASHVFDVIGKFSLLIGLGGGEKLVQFPGERFSTKRGVSGNHRDDPIDASVFHIQDGPTEKLSDIALTIEDLETDYQDDSKNVHMAAGFRVKKSNTQGNQANGKRECFPSVEYGKKEYSILKIDRENQIALAFENQVLMNGNWQTSPKPTGISGGAIIKVCGVSMTPPFKSVAEPKQKLVGITIEQRREKHRKPGALIGTRISVHLSLIHKYLPEVLV
ncbi:hypothetical protein [Pseudoalteromonas fuliginea]|uniref:hypothetical protein n=1 Tax=Pseudoalteromonas fuliginea TaxID=1872678 RepID=UPI00317227AF